MYYKYDANYGGTTSSSISSIRLLTLRMANAPLVRRKKDSNKIIKNILRNRMQQINRVVNRVKNV